MTDTGTLPPRASTRRLVEVVVALGLTTLGFRFLQALELLSDVPLWVIVALMVGVSIVTEGLYRLRPHGAVHVHVALQMLGITVVMYATGWGPVLAIGYMFGVADTVRRFGSSAGWPGLLWAIVGIGLGQGSVALDIAPTLVEERLAHGLAALGALGLTFPTAIITSTATQKEASESKLAHQAFYDPLTRLPNRTLFVDRLRQALARAQRRGTAVGVLFLDLDRFKVVNDSLGHGLGDQLLAAVAARLTSSLRPQDTVARMGGDEFTVLVEDVDDVAEAVAVAQRVLHDLEQPFSLGPHEVLTSASIGIAASRDATALAEDLLRDADLAMYQAKERGRARFEMFDAELGARAIRRLELEAELRHAVADRTLALHYQPEVIVATGEIVGVEALLRWAPAERRDLPLRELVTLAEETGLIVPVGRWVIEEACSRAREWLALLPDPRRAIVAVNFSVRQLQQPRLVSDVAGALEAAALEPERLRVEITESAMIKDVERGIEVVESLKALGVQIAIDDFGTGYSSLSYLDRLPADVLKIDRSFVTLLGQDREITAIVDAVIAMAHGLGMAATAEGVETLAQLEALRELGCDTCQGYLFSPPVPPAEMAALVGRGSLTPVSATGALG